jgi:type VI protein secretion system component Hcp
MNRALASTRALLTLVCAGAITPLAQAATDQFLQVAGIPGESQVRGYENWIEVSSFGQEYNRKACGGLTVTKGLDRASAFLAVAAVNGNSLAEATLAVQKAGEGNGEFLRMVLSDVVVSSITIQGVDPTRGVTEAVLLLPRSVTITYRQQDARGTLGQPMTTVITCNRQRRD